MEEKTQEAIDIILAQIYGLAQVINNLSIQVNNLINQNNNQNNQNNQIIDQVDLNKDQDNSPGLFSKKDQEMDIQESLNYIWNTDKLKFQVYHAVTPYVKYVKSETNVDVSDSDMWYFLSSKKLLRHFNNPSRHDQFLDKSFEERTKWIFNILCSMTLADKWRSDAAKYFSAGSSDNYTPSDHQIIESSSIPDPTPGLSEFEFCRNGVRYYFDAAENRDIEIPQDFLPRPDADAWLNPHSGWMHG